MAVQKGRLVVMIVHFGLKIYQAVRWLMREPAVRYVAGFYLRKVWWATLAVTLLLIIGQWLMNHG